VPDDTNARRDVFVHGPDLNLSVLPASLGLGDTWSLGSWQGRPGPGFLFLTEFAGSPFVFKLLTFYYDADGDWNLDVPITEDLGLSGLSATFQVLGFGGQLEDLMFSNPVTTYFE
jgi:hypothetical protein